MTKGTPFVYALRAKMGKKPIVFLRVAEVRDRVLYSFGNLMLLETAGQFPKRIRLGPRRTVWALSDILSWMQSKVDARMGGPASPRIVIRPDDRFIGKKELRGLVPYTAQHVRRLELAGKFPERFRIGANRSAWLEREVREWMEAHRSGSRKESDDA